tara:strand:- start:209 stop:871 length:663 start_codon:yes stop_codon:yes gene_type:complete
MDFLVVDLFSKEEALNIKNRICENESDWYSGKATALGDDSVKRNRQMYANKDSYIESRNAVLQAIESNWLVMSFAMPKLVHSMQFSRAKSGDGYGIHWDAPYMSQGRCDLAFTLFLEEKDKYEGGELFLATSPQAKTVKLDAGQAIFYPCNTLHQVKSVVSGERFVSIGWIHSQISNHEYRTNLFNIESNLKFIINETNRSKNTDLIFQSICNLQRSLGN